MAEAGENNLLQVAKVLKSNGVDGEVLMGFSAIAPEDIDLQEPMFIYYDGLPVPFYVKTCSVKGSMKALVRLEDISSKEDAEEIVGQGVYVDGDGYESLEEDEMDFVGWTLKDSDGTEIGKVTDIEDIPGNPCLCVETTSGEVLVPLHEDLIISLDEEKAIITMELPEGLV